MIVSLNNIAFMSGDILGAQRKVKVFAPDDDRSIDTGFVLQLCLGLSCIQEHETASKGKFTDS